MRGGMFATGIGRLTRDPTLRKTPQDIAVCEFSIACNYKMGEKEETSFVDCVAWRGLAEVVAKYATKGSAVFVRGRLQQNQWEARDGTMKNKLQIVVGDFSFLGERPSGDDTSRGGQPSPTRKTGDDIPF